MFFRICVFFAWCLVIVCAFSSLSLPRSILVATMHFGWNSNNTLFHCVQAFKMHKPKSSQCIEKNIAAPCQTLFTLVSRHRQYFLLESWYFCIYSDDNIKTQTKASSRSAAHTIVWMSKSKNIGMMQLKKGNVRCT